MSTPSRIAKIVGEDRVSTSTADRIAYGRDLWQRDLFGVREGIVPAGPEVIAWPANVKEVSALLADAHAHGTVVVPFGGGAGVCGAARSIEGSLVVDLKRLRAIRSIDAETRIAEVETGIVGEVLERELNHRGWTLGHFPSSIYCSTLGGFVAGRSAGQLSTKYGKIEDMITGLELVMPDGEVVQVSDDPLAMGPELGQVFTGAEGTLGICTAARLRVKPLAETTVLRAFSFKGVRPGLLAIRTLLQAGIFPAVVRLYDEFDTVLALSGRSSAGAAGKKTQKGMLSRLLSPKAMAGELLGLFPGVGKQAIALALKQAPSLNRIAGVMSDRCLLILMFEGPAASTELEATEAVRLLAGLEGEDLGTAPAERWKAKRYAISYRQSKVFAAGAFNDTAEVAATWDKLPALYREVKEAVSRHAFVMAHFSHAYAEGCSIYFTFLGWGASANESRALYDAIWTDLLAATVREGGTISHHHGLGISKARFLPQELGEGGMKALRAVKEAIDPEWRFNPGKLIEAVEGKKKRNPPQSSGAGRGGGRVPSKHLLSDLEDVVGRAAITQGPRAAKFLASAVPKHADPWVIAPSDASEVERTLALAAQAKVPVHIAGSSSRGIDWTSLPKGPSLVLDLAGLDAILAVDEISLTVTTQSGITCAALERALLKRGLTLGFALGGFAENVSIGGLLATGLPPLASPSRGTPAEHVVNVGWAMPDGTRVRTRVTPRAATGPDLDALLLGARGLLGVITEATLRIHREPEERMLLGFGYKTMSDAILTLKDVAAAGLPPTSAGIWPSAPGARRGARLAALYGGSAEWTRAIGAAARKSFKELGSRPDPKPDAAWFDHVDRASAKIDAMEPIWAYGTWHALARAAAAPALGTTEAAFGVPSFDRHGGYAVASREGREARDRAAAFEDAGCLVLRGPGFDLAPFSPSSKRLLARLKATLDPDDLLAPENL